MTSVPPEPVLGMNAFPLSETLERGVLVRSRVALSFSIVALLFDLYLIATTPNYRTTFTNLLILGSCWATGLGMGIVARRTRNGKAAIALSLLALILGIL